MKTVVTEKKSSIGVIIAILVILIAAIIGWYMNREDNLHPSSETAELDADLVHVASTVGGRLIDLRVKVNQHVKKGDLLYRIDPEPYQIAVAQAQANLDIATAKVDDDKRSVAVKTRNAEVAKSQVAKAKNERDIAARTTARLHPLAEQAYIPWQEFDQSRTSLHNAELAYTQAQQQNNAAEIAIGDLKTALASQEASKAALEHAKYELRQTVVTAPADGYISSLNIKKGEVLTASQVLFTLIVDDEWFSIANIREVHLFPIHLHECATVYSMINRKIPIKGYVDSIGWGVATSDSSTPGRELPTVARQMDWVHVAQRFPVRIRLEGADPRLLRLGTTSTVEIGYGAACH
ncbi:multidrug transporter subunit MdtN [Swingsia samuiensis]|uniref:Multidrug transporter subunit MdtN n=1 Tax=Swingsia samuiensis TaxID=1293412 RepID=A0A4Y6ULB6_9PROT|nr:multidrug transporter subunit MdtN [Swingsia samuiensis]QDH17181.1 multidrug transporter subunit MdtN [Swingsia samuiensis]